MSESKRSFTEEFKREAVQLAIERGNVSAVARELGIHESILNRWKRHLQQEAEHPSAGTRPFLGKGTVCDEGDRGSQYASRDFQAMLNEQGISCSMSRKGNCWDNAPVESFFGTLKQELVNFATRAAARQKVFSYIEV